VWYRLLRRYQPTCQSILEIGCSHGGFLAYCRTRGIPDVVGVEVSPETCAFARERFGLPHVNPGLFPAVDLPHSSYDVIAAFDLFEHLGTPVSTARAMLDALAPGGALLLQLPCYRGEGKDWPMFLPGDHLYLYTAGAIREALERAGFEVTAITKAIFWYDQFVVARRAGETTPGQRWRDRILAALPHRRKTTRAERHSARDCQ
jgi:SAM-dependent methyltransferase